MFLNIDLIELGANILKKKYIDSIDCLQESRIVFHHINQNFYIKKDFYFFKLIDLRVKGIPLAYVINEWSFYKLDLYISNKVLIPRSDTSVLVESMMKDHLKDAKLRLLDIGVGSGAILVELLNYFNNFIGTGVDINLHAIRSTHVNLFKYNLTATLLHKRFQDIYDLNEYDIIVSNPPYIKNVEKCYMNKDTYHEPYEALYQVEDLYQIIFDKCINLTRGGRFIYLEVSPFNYKDIIKIFEKGWVVELVLDSSNNPRVLKCSRG